MGIYGIRIDFRNPPLAGTSMSGRYGAAIDMVEWADRLGFHIAVLSVHHGSPDGYLPSPLPMAAACAARTGEIRINIAALVASFRDPIRLAEDIAVVDCSATGRKQDPSRKLGDGTSFVHFAHGAVAAEQIAPDATHQANAYGEWMSQGGLEGVGGYERISDAESVRATGQYRLLTPEQLVDELKAKGDFGVAMLHPLNGGIPPELGWQSLRSFEYEVLSKL